MADVYVRADLARRIGAELTAHYRSPCWACRHLTYDYRTNTGRCAKLGRLHPRDIEACVADRLDDIGRLLHKDPTLQGLLDDLRARADQRP